MNQPVKAALGIAATAVSSSLATAMFLATKSVDMYAIIDQINVVVVDVSKLVGMVTPLALGAYAAWKKTTKQNLHDAVTAPDVIEVAKAMPVTATTLVVAAALQTNGSKEN